MFNLNDIIGSIIEFMSSGAQESEIVQQITENIPGLDQITDPITAVTENIPEIPGVENITPGK